MLSATDNLLPMETVILRENISLPARVPDTHKGDYGRVLVVGGSIGYTGTPGISARAATKAGAGLVYVGVPESIYEIVAARLDEEMPFPLPAKDGKLRANAANEIFSRAGMCDVCLIGPGLGTSDEITEIVSEAIRNITIPLVLDADGLNAIANNTDVLSRAACPLILTPHPGEFARLGGKLSFDKNIGPDEKHRERLRAALDFAKKYGCVLVLKGWKTIIALPDGGAYVNTTGNPCMAKGGFGDVLAGMIAALIGQGIPIVDAVIAAVYLHGLAGDMCAAAYGEYSVTATDIINMLPNAFITVLPPANKARP
ncbi:MAG: NAD(P)H-hydrate dehydratase [Oscillospiraceae bacterium]|nr:NAD(P)H-hydrate dehydratase [Oscillospiraceae bacterium]